MTRTERLLVEITVTLEGLEVLLPMARGDSLENLCLLYTSTYMLKLRTMR